MLKKRVQIYNAICSSLTIACLLGERYCSLPQAISLSYWFHSKSGQRMLAVKRRRKHFSAFATWIGGRRESSGSKWGQEPQHVILALHHVCSSSLSVRGDSKGAIPYPLEPWGNAEHLTSWCFSSLWDSSVDPGIRARWSKVARWKLTSHPKPQHLLQICPCFWDGVLQGIPGATSTPLLQPQEDCAYETLDALQAHIFTGSSRVLW